MDKILYSSDKAAKFVKNIEGWVSSDGRFFGKDEHTARYHGCTHRPCQYCGKDAIKHYTACPSCREEKAIESYNKKERKGWDGKAFLYSEFCDQYFYNLDEIVDYTDEHNIIIGDLRLIICEPMMLSEVDTSCFEDDLPEDGEIPSEVLEALDELNEVIKSQGPVGWEPGKYAAIIFER